MPLYPFGYGLSYTSFAYSHIRLLSPVLQENESQLVEFRVTNTGTTNGDEVVQVYLSDVTASVPVPNYTLVGFDRIHLAAGESRTCRFVVTPDQYCCYDDDGCSLVEPGEFRIYVGGHAPVPNGKAIVDLSPLMDASFTITSQIKQTKQVHVTHLKGIEQLPYLLYSPDFAITNSEEQYPLMVFLHGMGERGDNLAALRVHGLPKVLENGMSLPMFVVSPQCPRTTTWSDIPEVIAELIESLCKKYPVDPGRIYLTGLSMGGFGVWKLLVEYPGLFAAAAPICGGLMEAHYQPSILEKIVDIPVWNFHGDVDSVVPVTSSDFLVEKLREFGGKIRYTRYPGVDHDSWTATYDNKALYRWFLSKSR